MSEAELHVLRARLRGGILNKARRGELELPLPIGFCYDANTPRGPRSRHAGPGAIRLLLRDLPAHRLGHRDGEGLPHAGAHAFRDARDGAGQGGDHLGRARALARALGPAQSALRRRLRLRPQPSTPALADRSGTFERLPAGAVDRAHSRTRTRATSRGTSSRTTSAACARTRRPQGTDRRRSPRPRRARAAAGPGALRTLRRAHDGPLPSPPRPGCSRPTSASAQGIARGEPICERIPGAHLDIAVGGCSSRP